MPHTKSESVTVPTARIEIKHCLEQDINTFVSFQSMVNPDLNPDGGDMVSEILTDSDSESMGFLKAPIE